MKRQKFVAGDLFAIPFSDKTFGLGHIIDCDRYCARCVLFAKRAKDPHALLEGIDTELRRPLTIMELTANSLVDGTWPIVGNRSPEYPDLSVPTQKDTSYTSGAAPAFLEAWHGLEPWDGMFDPKEYEKQLIPGIDIPPSARYRRDFTRDELAAFQASYTLKPETSAPVTEVPALLTIQIIYPGDGLPSTDLLHQRQEMERRLEAEGAGEVEGTESGAGVMEIYLRTDEVRRAVPLVEKIGRELGFADDMLIESAPIEDDEDDEDDDS